MLDVDDGDYVTTLTDWGY